MPDDNNTTPLINTIRETTIAAIAKKYNIEAAQKRFDLSHSQSDSDYIEAQIDDYNQDIQDIINEIPDDPPPTPPGPSVFVLLPKSPADSFGGYNTVVEACDLDGNYIPYSRIENFITGNSSMICNCFNNSSMYGYVDTGVSVSSCIINNSGNVAWKSTRYYQNDWCAFCAFISDSTGVTVVDIFESQAPYRCFKSFYCDGKYFVLDKAQKQWVSDLSTLGYQTTPVEGVVYPFGAFCLTEISFSGYVSKTARTWNGQYIECNDGLGYSCVGAYRVNGSSATSQFSFERTNYSTSLMIKNELSTAYIYSARYSTQRKLPYVEKFYAKTLSGSSTAQSVTLQPNGISRWLYETITQSSYMGFTPAGMNVSDDSYNVVARKGISALFDNTDGGQGTYSNYCISIRNDTGAALTCTYARVALCQSNLITVTIENVYNTSNVVYNAFKYNDGTTDYYYVLDGTQTDWTDDLSSIGYHLPQLWNLKVYGLDGGTISLSQENNFMYVFEEQNNRYIMLNGGTSDTVWEIISIIDTNGNEVSKESDYIWWINRSNIYYKSSPTRSVSAAYILLKTTPPLIEPLYLNSTGGGLDTRMSYLSPYYLYRNGSQIPYSSAINLLNVYNAAGTKSTLRFSLANLSGFLALKCDSGDATVCYCEVIGL